jgi:hypothetical protein
MIWKIEIDIEPPEIAGFPMKNGIDLDVRKDLAARRLFDVRQRHEASRQNAPFDDRIGTHCTKHIPSHVLR